MYNVGGSGHSMFLEEPQGHRDTLRDRWSVNEEILKKAYLTDVLLGSISVNEPDSGFEVILVLEDPTKYLENRCHT